MNQLNHSQLYGLYLFLKCILGIKIHSIYFYNAFEKAKKVKDVYIEIPTNFTRGRGNFIVVHINKIIYGLVEVRGVWYQTLKIV